MVIVRIWEGLGNQMFQYAYARALKEKGIDVRLDIDEAYKESFSMLRNETHRTSRIQNFRITIPAMDISKYGKYAYLSRDGVIDKCIFWLAERSFWKYNFYEEKDFEYSKEKEKTKGNYYVKGYFQDPRYFEGICPALLEEFTPKKKISLSRTLRNALEDQESVSVHIRRGDYVRLNWALNPAYYVKAIDYIKKIYEDPVFLFFSDDLDWAKKNIPVQGKCIYVNEGGGLEDYEELFMMSRCKSNIIANSTFSWWAAWMNQNRKKAVIAPRKWKMERPGLVPDEWIAI